MDETEIKKKLESKAEAAASFGKKKYLKTKYVEKVYTYKDGSCRVIEPVQGITNDEINNNL